MDSIAIINSLTKKLTLFQLINIHIGINRLVNIMKGKDISSTPKFMGPQLTCRLSTIHCELKVN